MDKPIAVLKLFPIPNNYILSKGTARYYSSLTPPWSLLKNTKYISFKISFDDIPVYAQKIPHENPINIHLFKPKYYTVGSGNLQQLYCIVSSKEVLAHTVRALSVLARHLGNTNLLVTVKNSSQKYAKFCKKWQVADKVIFCWKESFLKFLKALWLLQKGVPKKYVEELVFELENRLKEPNGEKMKEIAKKIYKNKQVNLEDFEKVFQITHQENTTPCISSINLSYNKVDISVVQLTWGLSLSKEMIKAILKLNPKIKKIGIVGGVGFTKKGEVQLDDIFLPQGIVIANKKGEFERKSFENHIFTTKRNTYFRKKRIAQGYMKTIVPKIGILSNTATFKNTLRLISAFDMELEGLISVLKDHPAIQFASGHYVMDMSYKGYTLGDTYYYRPYLKKLFKTFNRGKYYCFERILRFISTRE